MSSETLSNLRAAIALGLLGLSLPCLAQAYARALSVLRSEADVGSRRLVAGSLAAAAIARILAPKQIVTMYIGYLLTQQAIELSTASHYGVGSLALYHALFAVLPHDHAALLWTNAVVGALTLPLSAAFAARYLRSARAGAIFAALVALVPLFVKNDASDANHVPCLWWLFGGLVLWDEYLESGARTALAAAVPLFAMAAGARPEMPLLLPVLLGILTFGMAPPRARLRDPALVVAGVVTALLVLPHAAHVLGAAAALEERDSLPGTGAGALWRMARATLSMNTVLTPSLYPIALAVLAAAALGESLVLKRSRETLRARLALAVAAGIALATYGLDLCRANMARVHVPGALLVTMLAAAGIALVWERARHPAARAALVLSVGLAAVPTARALWAPTNEQAEEDFLREALARLPDAPYTLVRMDRADRDRRSPGADFTHHHFPDYLVRPPMGKGRVSSIRDFIAEPDLDRPAYFYWGMRCHAEFRGVDAPRPHGDALQPACARMREAFALEPVVERTVPNRGDVWLEYYGDAPSLRLGLHRINMRGR